MGRCKCSAQGGKRPMPHGERTRPQRPRSTTRRETPGIQRGGQSHCRERVQQPTIHYEAGLDDRCRLHRPGADRGAARCSTGAERNAAGTEEPARREEAAQRWQSSTTGDQTQEADGSNIRAEMRGRVRGGSDWFRGFLPFCAILMAQGFWHLMAAWHCTHQRHITTCFAQFPPI